MTHTIVPLRAFKDNYIWLIEDKQSSNAWAVDPGDAQPVIDYLHAKHIKLSGILITHHHADHTGGVSDLLRIWQNIPVYGFSKKTVPAVTHVVKENDVIWCGSVKLAILEISGHTLDHIAYYNDEIIFSGDTLFSAGCGRVFEGTYEQMYQSLLKLLQLPEKIQIYCGHEYTLQNLKFARHVEPNNQFIQNKILAVESLLATNHPSLPSTLADEKKMNPFLRCEESSIVSATEKQANKALKTPVDVFTCLRNWKNHF
jgi:hydroxyacylglutathione hydrolase